MLSKPATMLLGLINEKPLNAYEIIKVLEYMNIKYWFNIADSTVYTTIKTFEKRGFILGTVKKDDDFEKEVSEFHIANVKRMIDIVLA